MTSYKPTNLLPELLAACSDMLVAGSSMGACLERYPEHASALEPLLQTVAEVHGLRAVPQRSPAVAAQSRATFMMAANQLAARREQAALTLPSWPVALEAWWQRLLRTLRGANAGPWTPRAMPSGLLAILLVVVITGLLMTTAVTTAANTLPGDILYPVKTATESVRLLLTRGAESRMDLLQELAEVRVREAKTILDLRRTVPSMALTGAIEAIQEGKWTVAGLDIVVEEASQIVGTPEVGRQVRGRIRAPGDGTLLLVSVEILPPSGPDDASGVGSGFVSPFESPMGVPLNLVAPETPPLSPTPSEESVRGFGPVVTAQWVEPTDRPSPTPTPTPTATPTRTPSPLPTATLTATTAPTPTPFSEATREHLTVRISGYVVRIEGGWWTIGEVTVQTRPDTIYSGSPGLGSYVEAFCEISPEGAAYALQITQLRPPDAPPERLEFTGTITAIEGDWWTIGPYRVRTVGTTQYENDPRVGDMAEVKAERRSNGEIVALSIKALRAIEVHFEGVIEEMGATWIIAGNRVTVNEQTQIIGAPAVGVTVQVAAEQMPDGTLIAKTVAVKSEIATATP